MVVQLINIIGGGGSMVVVNEGESIVTPEGVRLIATSADGLDCEGCYFFDTGGISGLCQSFHCLAPMIKFIREDTKEVEVEDPVIQTIDVNFKIPKGYTLIKYAQPVKGDLWLNEALQRVHKMEEESWTEFRPIVEVSKKTSVELNGVEVDIHHLELLYSLMNLNSGEYGGILSSIGFDNPEDLSGRDPRHNTAKAIRQIMIDQGIESPLLGI